MWKAQLGWCLVFALAAPVSAKDPEAGPLSIFADAVAGPEGIAFTRRGGLIVGTTTGDVLKFDADGNRTVLASTGDPLAGITVLRDGRVLATSVAANRVWAIDPDAGGATEFASVPGGPNFVVQTRNTRRILVSASSAGKIVDITSGTPVDVLTGLTFPNGMAIYGRGRKRSLYVAETLGSRVLRIPLDRNDNLGTPEVYATGLTFADGLAFDRRGNLLVVGGDTLKVVARKTAVVTDLSTSPLIDFASNLAFGRGRGFKRRDVYLVNFGAPLGSGTTIVKVPYNFLGSRLIR